MKKINFQKLSAVLTARERAELLVSYYAKEAKGQRRYREQISAICSNIPEDHISEIHFFVTLSNKLPLVDLDLIIIKERLFTLNERLKQYYMLLTLDTLANSHQKIINLGLGANEIKDELGKHLIRMTNSTRCILIDSEGKLIFKERLDKLIKKALQEVCKLYQEALSIHEVVILIESHYFNKEQLIDRSKWSGCLCLALAKDMVNEHNRQIELKAKDIPQILDYDLKVELPEKADEKITKEVVRNLFNMCSQVSSYQPDNPFEKQEETVV